MGRTLRDAGYLVKEVESGDAALTALEKYTPDLILSDLRMPDMNGFDLLDHIKKLPKVSSTPVIFLSAIDDFHAKKVARDLGAVDCISKPIDKDEVLSLLKKYLPR